MSCTLTIIKIYYKTLKKNCSKIQLYEKVFFGPNDMQSFFYSNVIGSFDFVCTYMLNYWAFFVVYDFTMIIFCNPQMM
jgi:hypothetical protein